MLDHAGSETGGEIVYRAANKLFVEKDYAAAKVKFAEVPQTTVSYELAFVSVGSCDYYLGKDKDDYLTSFEVGIKTVHELAWVYPNTPVIAVSTAPTEDLARIQPLLSPIQAFSKPTHAEDLMAIVTRAKIPVTTESH